MRLTILKWIDRVIFKTPEAHKPHNFTMWLYKILFPIKSTYEHQSDCHYNPILDTYTIMGIKYSGELLRSFADGPFNHPFIIVSREDGYVTIEDYPQKSKECDGWCGMNYCDENGCMNRERSNATPIPPPEICN